MSCCFSGKSLRMLFTRVGRVGGRGEDIFEKEVVERGG